MTPEQAEEIYHAAAANEYADFKKDYTPVNQRRVRMAGFAAVISAVTSEIDKKYAINYLKMERK